MSGLLAGKVWQSNLGPHLKPLAAAMADIANDDGSSIFPSVAYLAWLLGKGERSVQCGLGELKTLGVISAVAYDQGGRGHATEYHLHEAQLPERPPWKETRKGATSAPFGKRKGATSDTKKGATSVAKGCNLGQQRVQPTAPDPSVDPSVDPSKETKERQRGTRLPDDFSLSSNIREWAAKEAPHVNLEVALAEFRDYWVAVPGADGRKLDWPATFRNRLRVLEPRASRNGFNGNGVNPKNTGSESRPGSDYKFTPKRVIR